MLNNAVGGVNPAAVEWMHRVHGSRGKVVWLPTFESDKHVRRRFPSPTQRDRRRAGRKVTPDGGNSQIIARENLVPATGHVHPEEIIAVVKRGRELGVKNIPITHGLTNVPGLTMAQAKEVAVEMGAMISVLPAVQGRAERTAPFLTHWTQVNAKNVAQGISMARAPACLVRPGTERQHHPSLTG